MDKVFFAKNEWTTEEYIKNLFDCIENEKLCIARFNTDDGISFGTAESFDDATEIEKIKVDAEKVNCDKIKEEFDDVIACLERDDNVEIVCGRVPKFNGRSIIFAKRIKKLIELNASKIIIENEKKMLIDSLTLKNIAVGLKTNRIKRSKV